MIFLLGYVKIANTNWVKMTGLLVEDACFIYGFLNRDPYSKVVSWGRVALVPI